MHFLPLLGKQLKDDKVIELLEDYDIQVTYTFDRIHENSPDEYWAASKEDGFQLRFDADQKLDVMFLYLAPIDGFTVIDCTDIDIPIFAGVAQAEAWCLSQNLRLEKGQGRGGALHESDWVRIESDLRTVHYEFRQGVLALVTVMLPNTQ